MKNFRICDGELPPDKQSVEVDLTIRITPEAAMNNFSSMMSDLQKMPGVVSVTIDDLPPGVVVQMVSDMLDEKTDDDDA